MAKKNRPTTTGSGREGSPSDEQRARIRGRRQEVRAREAATARQRKIVVIAGAAIAVVIIAMVAIKVLSSSGPPADAGLPVSPTVMQDLTSIPASVSNQIGPGTAQGLPVPVRAQILRGASGLPSVVYVGAEYCPYCAAERWPMIVALSRFGTFSNLRTARSAADDVYPRTPTFTFYGASYRSQYLEFTAVETQTSTRVGNTYPSLQTPTAGQQQIIDRYDGPPYVPSGSAGAIPFVDVANQYVISGTSLSPALLDNQSWEAIASSLANPRSAQAQAIVGSANVITAAICSATGDNPRNVCGQPAIQQIETTLAKAPVPKGAG